MTALRLLLCVAILSMGAFFMLGSSVKDQNLYRAESGEGEGGEADRKWRKKAYIELMHKAAPGTDWRAIERKNTLNSYMQKKAQEVSKSTATFANGYFTGDWYERGNNNQAGRITSFAYDKPHNDLYGMSDGGTIWKIQPPGGSWSLISDDFEFNSRVIAVAPVSSSVTRVLAAHGEDIMYTDNNGSSFTPATGITYQVSWGSNHVSNIVTLADVNSTVYCTTLGWDNGAWAPRVYLYRSTDKGATFTHIHTFNADGTDKVSLFSPLGSGALYALAVTSQGSDTLFSINGTNVTSLNTTTAFGSGADACKMVCMQSGPTNHFYTIIDRNRLYYSNNNGSSWTLQSNLPGDMWDALGVSSISPNFVHYGEVECHRSSNGGNGWNTVNNWYDYYGAELTNLHADIQSINYYQYTNNTEFCIIGTDGGAYISTDHLANVTNISMTGLRINQLWDHISVLSNPAILFGGTQDQGLAYTGAAGGTGIVNMTQLISGDYGQMRITGNETTLWTEYPGGDITLWAPVNNNPQNLGGWTMTGTDKPNYGWMLSTSDFFSSGTQNEILVGGGEINGGPGSYLIKLTADAFYNVTPSQYPYDFRANSNTGSSGISAIAVSKINNNLMYVACEDGSFFYSTNAGNSWNHNNTFTGPEGYWLYGSSILPSKLVPGKVFFAGSGYSNPAVYMSTNNGQTFTQISNGLPQTLVNRLALNPAETMLFAATEAGPYVYIFADNQWYSLQTPNTPIQNWKTVEYLPSISTVRFGTYGRGIWDLNITSVTSTPIIAAAGTKISDMQLAPNPAKSGGAIQVLAASDSEIELSLLSINGSVAWSGRVKTNTQVSLPELPAGIYACQVRAGKEVHKQLLTITN